ncbi:heat stress transcription factor A-like protein, putative [Medicago truncatula]|uniref:Heat stress transcription factor A-like protein, putative n=1 Tax=Medicago truncatula TaxID=3880 RepID=G7KM12_MEDTR|nr:heat stress transcription factor A-like protein, putative [Medicago truncatula]
MNLVSGSTQGSNEDEESLQKNMSKGEMKRMQTRTGLAFTPETLDHVDTRASFTFNMNSCISQRTTTSECPNLHSLEPSTEEGDSHISNQ